MHCKFLRLEERVVVLLETVASMTAVIDTMHSSMESITQINQNMNSSMAETIHKMNSSMVTMIETIQTMNSTSSPGDFKKIILPDICLPQARSQLS